MRDKIFYDMKAVQENYLSLEIELSEIKDYSTRDYVFLQEKEKVNLLI
jgi:hypothetical protein